MEEAGGCVKKMMSRDYSKVKVVNTEQTRDTREKSVRHDPPVDKLVQCIPTMNFVLFAAIDLRTKVRFYFFEGVGECIKKAVGSVNSIKKR